MGGLVTSFSKTYLEVVHRKEFDVEVEKAWEICLDYEKFLQVMLRDQKSPMNATWVSRGPGEVGGELQYMLDREGSTTQITEKIVRLEKTEHGYILAWEQTKSVPQLPLSGYGCVWELRRSRYDRTKTDLIWTRHFREPLVLGVVPIGNVLRESFIKTARPILEIFRSYYASTYPKRFPTKKDKICIVGAGPSGLHMAHLLITKGYSVDNITILEKTNRYGGKTVTLPDHTSDDPTTVHELGTCYLHPAYYAVRSLFLDLTKTAINVQLTEWIETLRGPSDVETTGSQIGQPLLGSAPAIAALTETKDWLATSEGQSSSMETLVAKLQKLQSSLSQQRDVYARLNLLAAPRPGEIVAPAELEFQGAELFLRPLRKFKEIAPKGTTVQTAGNAELGFESWITSKLQVQPGFSLFALPRILFPTADTAAELLIAKDRYNRIHNDYFGLYNYTMPPQLSAEAMRDLDMPFGAFLAKNKLTALTAVLAYGQTCQGYGTIEETPTFWAMCWITPDLLNQYFAIHPEHEKKTMLRTGWITLWDDIVRLDHLNITYNVDITRIIRDNNRSGGKKVKIDGFIKRGTPAEKSFSSEFDFLIMACPIVDIKYEEKHIDLEYEPLPIDCRGKVEFQKSITSILDLTPEERATFGDNVENGQFRTTLFKMFRAQPMDMNHLTLYMDKIIGPNAGRGHVFAFRDSYLALHPEYADNEDNHLMDPDRDNFRERMAYQYVENNLNMKEADLQKEFHAWADVYIGPHREVLFEQTWDYFRRYNSKGIRERDPWKILMLQGKNATLYVHASTFFESVLDIVNYNNMLYSCLTGEFNEIGFDHPQNDEKPQTQTGLLTPIGRFGAKVVLPVVSFVMNTIFTVSYIALWPFTTFFVFRLQNWYLQWAFRTKDIGWWPFSMSLDRFIYISPSVRCLVDKNEDPIVTTLFTHPDRVTFPGIQRVQSASQWNYQDYRTMIADWMRLIKPRQFTFIGPRIKAMFWRFQYYFPITYNYLFSWGAGISFAHLTGWGYHVDDENGGGWYVPRCAMLDAGRKKYGEEVGSRICTHVCKIFTEEWLRKKGISVTLQPNHTTGSCMIRGTKPRGTCCSDNSIQNDMSW